MFNAVVLIFECYRVPEEISISLEILKYIYSKKKFETSNIIEKA